MQVAAVLTCMLGAFGLIHELVIARVVGMPVSMGGVALGTLFVLLGLGLSRGGRWCAWIALALSLLVTLFHAQSLLVGSSSSLMFMLFMGFCVLVSNTRVVAARRHPPGLEST